MDVRIPILEQWQKHRLYKKKLQLYEQQQQNNQKRKVQLQKLKERETKAKIRIKNFTNGWKQKLIDRIHPNRTILIEMLHMNGTVSHYYITSQKHKFSLKGCAYVVDEERKLYCNTSRAYMYRYHEGFSIPFSIDVTADEMKKGLKSAENYDGDADGKGGIKEIQTSFNPSVLKEILKFEYAKGVIQGAEIHDFIKKGLIVGIVTLISVLIHLALSAYKGGWI